MALRPLRALVALFVCVASPLSFASPALTARLSNPPIDDFALPLLSHPPSVVSDNCRPRHDAFPSPDLPLDHSPQRLSPEQLDALSHPHKPPRSSWQGLRQRLKNPFNVHNQLTARTLKSLKQLWKRVVQLFVGVTKDPPRAGTPTEITHQSPHRPAPSHAVPMPPLGDLTPTSSSQGSERNIKILFGSAKSRIERTKSRTGVSNVPESASRTKLSHSSLDRMDLHILFNYKVPSAKTVIEQLQKERAVFRSKNSAWTEQDEYLRFRQKIIEKVGVKPVIGWEAVHTISDLSLELIRSNSDIDATFTEIINAAAPNRFNRLTKSFVMKRINNIFTGVIEDVDKPGQSVRQKLEKCQDWFHVLKEANGQYMEEKIYIPLLQKIVSSLNYACALSKSRQHINGIVKAAGERAKMMQESVKTNS